MRSGIDHPKTSTEHWLGLQAFPFGFFYAVLFVCFAPFLMLAVGVTFSVAPEILPDVTGGTDLQSRSDRLGLRYDVISLAAHILLEWTAVIMALLTTVLAFSHYAINRNLIVPVIGFVFLSCALMDGFHTLASMRVVPVTGNIDTIVSFTWVVARMFYAVALIFGSLLCLWLYQKPTASAHKYVGLFVIGLMFSLCGVIGWTLTHDTLPEIDLRDTVLSRPYNIFPLIAFLVAAPILAILYKKVPSYVTASLLITLVPNIVLQTHMAFGSHRLFDAHYNIAHGLKVISYLVPFLGLTLDFIQFRRAQITSETKLRSIMDNIPEGLITVDDKGSVEAFNPSAERIFGLSAQEIFGQDAKVLVPERFHKRFEAYLSRGYRGLLSSGSQDVTEIQGLRADGTEFPLDLSISHMTVGGRRLYSAIIRDITKRKASQEELERTLMDLRLSNEDLQKFAYIASHDLKSPLRAIDNLSSWLAEDLKGKLDASSQEHIDKLRSRVKRMENLLESLLEFSRAGEKIDKTEIVNTHDLCQEIVAMVNVPKGFQVRLDASLERVILPKMPLEQVLHNLISNGIKHHDQPNGYVDVRVNEHDMFFEFVVEDDGPGVPDRYHEQIFEMFQTLRRRDEVEGSGMGLAVVKKIIHRVGGRYDLTSSEGVGTKISVFWPRN